MTKIIQDVEPQEPAKPAFGECPHCSKRVDGFKVEANTRDDAVITLWPCGCTSHTNDGRFKQFADLVNRAGTL
jgi:hypothetical protein